MPDDETTPPSPCLPTLRVLAHPLRLRLLSLLTGASMSAAEAARELGETQANVSYHLRRLHDAGLLEVAGQTAIRGGLAKRYRHRHDSGERAAPASAAEHRRIITAVTAVLAMRAERRRDGAAGHLTDAELWIDPEVWRDVLARADALGADLHDAARPPRTPGTIPVAASLLLFELDGDDGPAAGEQG